MYLVSTVFKSLLTTFAYATLLFHIFNTVLFFFSRLRASPSYSATWSVSPNCVLDSRLKPLCALSIPL